MLSSFAIKYYPLIQVPNKCLVHSASIIQNKWRIYWLLKCIRTILKLPYFKNEAAISGAVHNTPRHENAIKNVFNQFGYNLFKIPSQFKKYEILKWNDNPELATVIPIGSYVEQPCGTHNSPDFIIKVSNNLVIFLEAKSSKTTFPLYNSGSVKQNYIYIFCSEQTNETTIYKGSSIMSPEQHKLITEHIEKSRKADEDLNAKLKQLDINNRGICYYTRPMINQSGGKFNTNYFEHKYRKKSELNALNWIKYNGK
jgi:hypothetical protein